MRKVVKPVIAIFAMLVAYSNTTNAQNTTATPTLSIIINPLLNITSNANATLTYAAPTDYTNGVNTTVNGQLTVTSMAAYTVSVKAGGNFSAGGDTTIALNNVSVTTTTPTAASGIIRSAITNVQTPSLSTSDQAVFSGAWALLAPIDMKYAISGTNSSTLNTNGGGGVLGTPAGTYVATLTYTISNP